MWLILIKVDLIKPLMTEIKFFQKKNISYSFKSDATKQPPFYFFKMWTAEKPGECVIRRP